MASALAELGIAARLAARTAVLRARGRLEPEPSRSAFRRDLDALLDALPPERVRERTWIEMPADRPPWVATGIRLAKGEQATWFACGRVYVARALDLWVGPALQLWGRVGPHGDVFSGTRDTHTFAAPEDGELYVGNYFPNDWATRDGETVRGPEAFVGAQGGLSIAVVVWRGDAAPGLAALAARGDVGGAVASERERLAQGPTAPPGWRYLWHLGDAEIFRPADAPDGRPCIACHTHRDVGILQRDVAFPLAPDTRIAWQWKIDELPSRLREDATPTHDYLSLAVEFENGRDLSYYWSATLPPETSYACPLANWKDKETHLVVRSGSDVLGRWLREERSLWDDYRRAIGPPPERVVRVWFIAVSLFQRTTGRCQYADVRLSSGDGAVAVL